MRIMQALHANKGFRGSCNVNPAAVAETCLRASANVPEVAGRPILHRGRRLVDAAVFEPVPFQTAIADGCTHLITLCSRPPFECAPSSVCHLSRCPVSNALFGSFRRDASVRLQCFTSLPLVLMGRAVLLANRPAHFVTRRWPGLCHIQQTSGEQGSLLTRLRTLLGEAGAVVPRRMTSSCTQPLPRARAGAGAWPS